MNTPPNPKINHKFLVAIFDIKLINFDFHKNIITHIILYIDHIVSIFIYIDTTIIAQYLLFI